MKKYDIILADCPWRYADQKNNDPAMGGITYPTMTIAELSSLPISSVASKDCLLFMWATMPLLPEALQVMQAWGFKYTTCAFVWLKLNPNGKAAKREKDLILHGGIYSGLGHWTNGNVELCLMGKRGKPHRIAKNIKQVIVAPRSRHSAKPQEIYTRIEDLTGDKTRLELFARQSVAGWDTIGNQLNTSIEEWYKEEYLRAA